MRTVRHGELNGGRYSVLLFYLAELLLLAFFTTFTLNSVTFPLSFTCFLHSVAFALSSSSWHSGLSIF